MPGEGFATNAFAAGTPRPNPKTTSEWRVKLHRKISRPPQHSLATDGFAPGKTSIFMWELATGVLPDKHPQGFDALDPTRCVRLAVEMRGVRDWLFPDDWDEVLTMAGGPALVTREHLDAPALLPPSFQFLSGPLHNSHCIGGSHWTPASGLLADLTC